MRVNRVLISSIRKRIISISSQVRHRRQTRPDLNRFTREKDLEKSCVRPCQITWNHSIQADRLYEMMQARREVDEFSCVISVWQPSQPAESIVPLITNSAALKRSDVLSSAKQNELMPFSLEGWFWASKWCKHQTHKPTETCLFAH